MTRQEVLAAVLIAFVLVTVGVTWLFGPYGLVGAGVALGGFVLAGPNLTRTKG